MELCISFFKILKIILIGSGLGKYLLIMGLESVEAFLRYSGRRTRRSRTEKDKKLMPDLQNTEMIMMKMTWLIAFLIMLFLAVVPAYGDMTDYQRGVANGLKVGLFMGEYYGRGQYVVNYAGQFNTYLDTYNQFLGSSFGSNQTLLNEFTLSTIAVAPGYSKSGSPVPDASGRIFGYPAASYYTWTGAVPGTKLENPRDALPGV